jgi:hypothetical protein
MLFSSANDSHPGEGFGRTRVDHFSLLANGAKLWPNAVDPCAVSHKHSRQKDECSDQQCPVDPCKDDKAAEQLDQSSPWVIQHPEDKFSDTSAILAKDRSHAAGSQLMDAMKRQTHGVIKDMPPNVELNMLRNFRCIPTAPNMDDDLDYRDHADKNHRRRQQSQRRIE